MSPENELWYHIKILGGWDVPQTIKIDYNNMKSMFLEICKVEERKDFKKWDKNSEEEVEHIKRRIGNLQEILNHHK